MDLRDVRPLGLFDGLADAQLQALVSGGAEVRVEPGVVLFHEGQPADAWWVLVDGAVELVRHVGREDTVVGRMDVPGRWAGGFRAWDEHGVYLATGRGVADGRVLRVPAEVLRDLTGAWFPFGGHLIAGLYRTARSIESTARQREALVTLGTLAAGLAHEINNPASAATRAVDALGGASQQLLSALGRLARSQITAEQFTELDRLRLDLESRTPPVDLLALADAEEALTTRLSRRGLSRAWSVGPALAGAGADEAWCERAVAVLDGAALEPGLDWVAATLAVDRLLGEVRESTRRVSELVAAVRSYSQMDRGSLQTVDLRDGLESTLVMLGHKLAGVTVERRYGADVPRVRAFAGELNQVWTNLLDNAVDALGGTGMLGLSTAADGDHVVVEVSDTGTGMPPEVAARAFEPFYTTKEVGRGTGLGLDIVQRIVVERHGGTVTIDSRPGRTVLRVRLPVRGPAS
ncbi:Cyclic nucleotide-binding domain-containing protein [Friedmanniella luteola]|uniref:histidine kinase n=1 Tax=Friedmanniella luteola TaxID=546871 RepID=A0A1H1VWS5_9ACTN|nr:ATP-binding protein [Friedmanniella luteola]SDS89327.1 Cyclic nucleotide-binding domain-containing protein [Friedmanniella luteola]